MLTNWTKGQRFALLFFTIASSWLLYQGISAKIVWQLLLGAAVLLFVLGALFGKLQSFALATGFCILTLAFAEWFLLTPPLADFTPDSNFPKDYYTTSDLGSSAKPGAHKAKSVARTTNEVIYDVVYTIGDDGFRVTPEKSSSETFRINFFGCSFMIGEGLNDNETLPFHASEQLKQVTVKNFGWHGYGVHQAVSIMESQRDTHGKVNFLLTTPWHSDRSACLPSYSAGSPKYALDSAGLLKRAGVCRDTDNPLGVIRKILDRSAIYKMVEGVVQTSQSKRSQDANIDLYIALVKRMADISKERGQSLVIGFIKADENYFVGNYTNDSVMKRLRAISDDFVDLTLAEKSETTDPKYFIHPLDKHPSGIANAERASRLSGTFRQYLEH